MNCIATALKYRSHGLSVIPITPGTKKAAIKWQPFQHQIVSPAELIRSFGNEEQIAVVAGAVSGQLECMDFDQPALFQPLLDTIEGFNEGLRRKLNVWQQTPSGGYHLLYRCSEPVGGNTKLAMGPRYKDESGKPRQDVYIETRGQGGYFLVSPSVVADGKKYTLYGDIANLPILTQEEHNLLFEIARSCDEAGQPERQQAPRTDCTTEDRPGDRFNQETDWRQLLESEGWTYVKTVDDHQHWTRPGKDDASTSATLNNQGLFVFSSSTLLPTGQPLDKFSFYTHYRHNGDFKAAAHQLRTEAVKQMWSASGPSNSPGEWPEPSPLPGGLLPVKLLAPALIPAPLRDWLMDIADRMQIPPDFSTAAAVVALGSIIGRGCGIHPKKHDDWLVVPNLWGAVVGRPSLMKTPAISEAQKHLDRLETESREEYNKAASAFEVDKEVLKLTKSAISEEIKKAIKAGDAIDEARGRLAALQDNEPTRRRYQTQDATSEKIGELLNQNPRGLLIKRDELNPWFRALDKDGREGDRGFFLEAWNGTGGFIYDRIGRGTLDISALCASVFGALTPGPLSSYVYQASRGGNGDDGLLQRFQVIVWPDVPKGWKNVDRWPNTLAKSRAWKIFKTLSGDIPGAVPEAGDDIPSLRFSLDGQTVFDDWRNALEIRMRGEHGLPPEMESHLIKYRSLMPSLALIFHLVAVADGSTPPGPVLGVSAQMAVEWCEYLESHAARVYGGASVPGMEAAKEIVKHIQRGAIQDGCKVKDVYRNQWSRLTSPEEVKAGLDVLENYDWLTVEKVSTGGRPSGVINLNPQIKV